MFAKLDQGRYGFVLKDTIGVVFMGTPHSGSNSADLGDSVCRVINFLLATTTLGTVSSIVRRDLLTALADGSKDLHELDLAARQILDNIMVTSFYETLPQYPFNKPASPPSPTSRVKLRPGTNLLSSRQVVSVQSAILGLPDEDAVPFNANHRDICRFAHGASDCASVCHAIRRMHRQASSRRARPGSSRSGHSSA